MSVYLWCVGVEYRYGGRRPRWRSCRFVQMDQEWWRTSNGTWLRDRSHWVTRRGGWHLGHTRAQGHGGVGRVADVVEDCGTHVQDVGDMHMVRYSWHFGSWSSKTTLHCGWRVLLSLGLKTRRWRFERESLVARDITTKCASRQSNFVWSTWPSDWKPRSWSIFPLAE
jgi:hypothetical protein